MKYMVVSIEKPHVNQHINIKERSRYMSSELYEMVYKKYPNAKYDEDADITNMKKFCYGANTDGFGVVEDFEVMYISEDGLIFTSRLEINP
jgi:hypothetical protein